MGLKLGSEMRLGIPAEVNKTFSRLVGNLAKDKTDPEKSKPVKSCWERSTRVKLSPLRFFGNCAKRS